MDSVPVLPASSTGLPKERGGWPTESASASQSAELCPDGGHGVGVPLQASGPLSLSVLWPQGRDLPNYTPKQHTDR